VNILYFKIAVGKHGLYQKFGAFSVISEPVSLTYAKYIKREARHRYAFTNTSISTRL
jgi:hypothetical protein